MTIRHVKPQDVNRLSQIESASYPPEEGASLEKIDSRSKVFPECFWVLEEEDVIKGFICGLYSTEQTLIDEMYDDPGFHNPDGGWLHLFSVVTAPEHRKQKVASKLMKRVIEDNISRGKKGIVLTCKKGLIPFYSSFGFVLEGQSESSHGGACWYQMHLIH